MLRLLHSTEKGNGRIFGWVAFSSKCVLVLVLVLLVLLVESGAGNEVLVFDEGFDTFDLSVWKHEISMSGGGNWEFEYYTNNRSNSFVHEGVLHIQPTLTADLIGDARVNGDEAFTMSLWGLTPADRCTSNAYYGCERANNKGARLAINPIQSARISTAGRFNIKYGRVEVEAKLPVGDWIWPAIWLLPEVKCGHVPFFKMFNAQYGVRFADNAYGSWPASGEIDMIESRGNAKGYCSKSDQSGGTQEDVAALCPGGNNVISSTLHWGPYPALNGYPRTTGSLSLEGDESFGDDFHTFGLSWDETGLYTYVDGEDNRVLSVAFDKPFWQRGEFDQFPGLDNPWSGRSNAAPFDSGFYLVMNVAVGGVGGFFPDNDGDKPWSDVDHDAPLKFWEAKEQWYPTWKEGDSALQVKSVRVWQKPGGNQEAKGQCSCTSQKNEESEPTNARGHVGVGNDEGVQPAAHANDRVTYNVLLLLTIVNSIFIFCAVARRGVSVSSRHRAKMFLGRGGSYSPADDTRHVGGGEDIELR